MKIRHNVDLTPLNTLRLPARAQQFATISTIEEAHQLCRNYVSANLPILILGGGSNILFTRDFEGLVIKNEIKGYQLKNQSATEVRLEIQAGESWHDLVTYAVNNNWGGIENLALIPGTVGAAPVQNIAAYGQSLSETLVTVKYLSTTTHQQKELSNAQCQFSYRNSVFKQQLKGRAIITSVELSLTKNPELETTYYSVGGRNDSLQRQLSQTYSEPFTIKNVYDTVINIRRQKLLDWEKYPTVGSFFINPVIKTDHYMQLHKQDPDLQCYPPEDLKYNQLLTLDHDKPTYVKVPVGRLLDYLGWKGKQIGNCMVSSQLASILTHNGQATGKEFLAFADMIKADVKQKMDIELESEVNII